jgi:hypothetical protein
LSVLTASLCAADVLALAGDVVGEDGIVAELVRRRAKDAALVDFGGWRRTLQQPPAGRRPFVLRLDSRKPTLIIRVQDDIMEYEFRVVTLPVSRNPYPLVHHRSDDIVEHFILVDVASPRLRRLVKDNPPFVEMNSP